MPLDALGIQLRNEEFETYKANANAIRDLVTKKYPTVHWIDLTPYIPQSLLYQGMPIMGDTNHFNDYGAKVIAGEFLKDKQRLINPEDLSHPNTSIRDTR